MVHTIVSFLFPKEYRDFLSFLVLCDVVEGSGDNEDNVWEDNELDEEDVRVELLHGVLGADWEAGCWQFSSASSMRMMAETEEGRRFERVALVGGVGFKGSLRGRWTEMALRRQLSHCCLWKTSLTCNVWDCGWFGS